MTSVQHLTPAAYQPDPQWRRAHLYIISFRFVLYSKLAVILLRHHGKANAKAIDKTF